MTSIVEAVRAVEAVEGAKKRIPEPQRSAITYYGGFDQWVFQARGSNPCDLCRYSEEVGVFYGDQLRTWFPYHVILDVNTIGGGEPGGRGLVHPHCYCELVRKLD